jgi:hypothetical protein
MMSENTNALTNRAQALEDLSEVTDQQLASIINRGSESYTQDNLALNLSTAQPDAQVNQDVTMAGAQAPQQQVTQRPMSLGPGGSASPVEEIITIERQVRIRKAQSQSGDTTSPGKRELEHAMHRMQQGMQEQHGQFQQTILRQRAELESEANDFATRKDADRNQKFEAAAVKHREEANYALQRVLEEANQEFAMNNARHNEMANRAENYCQAESRNCEKRIHSVQEAEHKLRRQTKEVEHEEKLYQNQVRLNFERIREGEEQHYAQRVLTNQWKSAEEVASREGKAAAAEKARLSQTVARLESTARLTSAAVSTDTPELIQSIHDKANEEWNERLRASQAQSERLRRDSILQKAEAMDIQTRSPKIWRRFTLKATDKPLHQFQKNITSPPHEKSETQVLPRKTQLPQTAHHGSRQPIEPNVHRH